MKMVYDMSTGQPVETGGSVAQRGLAATADAPLLPELRLQEIASTPLETPPFPPELAFANLTLFLKQMD